MPSPNDKRINIEHCGWGNYLVTMERYIYISGFGYWGHETTLPMTRTMDMAMTAKGAQRKADKMSEREKVTLIVYTAKGDEQPWYVEVPEWAKNMENL